MSIHTLSIFAVVVGCLMVAGCAAVHRELSDSEWCQSFDYRPGTPAYQECRQRIERQRQRVKQKE